MSEAVKEIRIEDEEDDVGQAAELGPKDRARLALAGWLLVGLFVLTLLAGFMMLFAPDNRLEASKDFFAFVKAAAPPLVTLVIGFYFNAQGE